VNNLQQKNILITGASSGIGLACAELFAENGANLILAARRLDRLNDLSDRLRSKFTTETFVRQLDIRSNTDVERLFHDIPEKFSRIDVLVNNAGLSRGLDPVTSGKLEDWEEMIDTNVKGLLYVTRMALPGMISRNSGHIINIGSIAGRQVYPNGNVYCATKYAVRALTQGIMMETFNTKVKVSTVDPGLTETEFSMVRYHGDTIRAASTYQGLIPLTAEDVARSVLFVASQPAHANIAELVLLPTDQASVYHVNRQ
jgi:serine 3-dehydrogenase